MERVLALQELLLALPETSIRLEFRGALSWYWSRLNQRCDLRHLAKLGGSHGVAAGAGGVSEPGTLPLCIGQAPLHRIVPSNVSGVEAEEPHLCVSVKWVFWSLQKGTACTFYQQPSSTMAFAPFP